MRKRIEELAGGKFECAEPIPEFSTDRVEIEVLEGKNFTGEFTVSSKNHVPVRGMAYTSNPRMDCLTPQFEGEEVRIRYEFHSEGLTEGDIQKGEFFIVCNQGEYNLSFVAVVLKMCADSSMGSIRNLNDFTRLAQENWGEARKIFYSSNFKSMIKQGQVAERLLYEGIGKGIPSDQNMEEFLLASKRKQNIMVEAESTQFTFYKVGEKQKKTVLLRKNTWGYVSLKVSSDADFVEPEKNRIVSEDFLGSSMEFSYYLNPEKMHAGKNFACLMLENVHQQIMIRICASREESVERDQKIGEVKKLYVQLLNLYVDYRLKKIVTGKWASNTCRCLDDLLDIEADNVWYSLLKAQVFLANRQKQEAEWILNKFKRKWKDKKSPQWGYYLYICTLMEREEVYVNRLTEEIEQIYLEHQESTFLFWSLLFLREDYTVNRYRKLKALEERIAEGNESPLFFVEAYCLFYQEPYLLNHLGEFELKVLNWARKQKMLTESLAEQVLEAIPEKFAYQRLVLLLLEACYEQLPDERMLGAICSYLIKNQKYGKRYFSWYEKGIEQKIRITGLYEAYLMSMDPRNVVEVPKIILMYFKYNNSLGYRQKAILYVNIIANKEHQPEVYEQYRQTMESFVCQQMEAGHMDDNLAVIYEEILSGAVRSKELSKLLSKVLFVHKLTCFEKSMVRVIVIQRQMQNPQVVPIINGVAYFQLYSNDYCIFIEDSGGNRYSGSVSYQLEKLMYPGRYLRSCMKYSPGELPYLLYYFSSREGYDIFEEKDICYFQTIMESEEVRHSYQAWLFPKMSRLLRKAGRAGEIGNYLEKIDFSLLLPKERGNLLEILIENHFYEYAYRIAEQYGFENVSRTKRVQLLSSEIKRQKFAESEELLKFCADTYRAGKQNEALLQYLCRYYQGTTKVMASIWKHAQEYRINTFALEERILEQMLYTTEFVDCVSELYQHYEPRGDRRLKEAYLVYFSYCSFVKNMVPPEHLYEHLRKWRQEEKEMHTVCELALFRYVSEWIKADQVESHVEEFLAKYLFRGMYFAFYKNLSPALTSRFLLYDKYFIEYHAQRKKKVQIHYKMRDSEEDYLVEDMAEMYGGIFVKELILFSGEAVQYYISEETDKGRKVTESNLLVCDGKKEDVQNRYDRINEMIESRREEDGTKFAMQMEYYKQLTQWVEERFTIL